MPVIFIAKDDEVSKKKTNELFALKSDLKREIENQMILVEEENAIVPNNPGDVEIMKTFLSRNPPPGMTNLAYAHWYVPPRVEY